MSPVPILKPREVVKTFKKLGWEVARGTLRSLIARAGITMEEFLETLEK